ncbi:MAG: hypothetical protein JXP34_04130 [Planctomycetes bacterium]|nr:hypothetical protein [Planctomycetota bacterium]
MRRIRWGPLLVFAAASGAVAAVLLVNPPRGETRSQAAAFDLGHVPAFGLVALAALVASRRWIPAARRRPAAAALIAFASAGLLGGAIEIVQGFVGRDAELGDLLLDLAGAGICVCLFGLLEAARIRTRIALGSLALAIAVAALAPLAACLAGEAHARAMFPVLSSFESAWDLRAWAGLASRMEIVRRGASGAALRVTFLPAPYPSISLRFFPRDWRGYRALAFTIEIDRPPPAPIWIRINDIAHDESYDDRFNRRLRLQPGRNDIEIPLAEIESAPRRRKLDLASVRSATIFADDLGEPYRLTISGVRLVR